MTRYYILNVCSNTDEYVSLSWFDKELLLCHRPHRVGRYALTAVCLSLPCPTLNKLRMEGLIKLKIGWKEPAHDTGDP